MPKLCNRSGEQAAASMTVSEPRARLTFSRIALRKSPYMQPALLATEKTCLYAMHPGQLGDLNPWAIVSSLISPRAPKFSVFPFVPVHNPEPTQMPQDCRSAAAPSFLLRPGILSVRNETPQKIKIKSKCSQWRFLSSLFFGRLPIHMSTSEGPPGQPMTTRPIRSARHVHQRRWANECLASRYSRSSRHLRVCTAVDTERTFN